LFHEESDLTGGFRSVRVWNQFQAFDGFLVFVRGFFEIEWGDVMKKLFASSFPWMRSMNNSHAMNSEEFAVPATAGLVKLLRLSMAVLLGTILLVFSARVVGQAVNATLLGTVADSSGAVVAGAKVTIKEMRTGVSRMATTNESGNYQFSDIAPGQYEVTVERDGFKKAVRTGVDVLVNSDIRVNVTIDIGTNQETVVVSSETPILETDRADTGRKIEERQVEDLPLTFNRNFQSLLNLVPGTTRGHREHSSFFNSQDSLRTEVNGQSGLANNVEFEGLNDNERTGLLSIYIPPIEAIQTVDVTTSNYDAELGRANGAVTNVILKSGTNDFHGAAYEINRISALAAVPFFQNTAVTPKANSVYNYYGANIGGPIVKNKTFFFGDFLRINDHQGQFFNGTVPPLPFRNGDFSQATSASGQLIPIYDPATGNPDGTGRTQFAFNGTPNVIDPTRISPIAKAILGKIPRPNVVTATCPLNSTAPGCLVATNNFQGTTKFIKDTTSFDVKIDHNISVYNRLSGRFSFSNQSLSQAPIFGVVGGPSNGAFSGAGRQRYWDVAVNYYHVFSPTLITEIRAGVDHYRNVANNTDRGQTVKSEIGVDIPGANLGDSNTSGMPCINLPNIIPNSASDCLAGYSASLPWIRGETNLNIANNWTKILGNHTFKWGVDIHRLRDDLAQWQDQNPRGILRFTNNVTSLNTSSQPVTSSQVNAVASFLLDMPNSVGRDVPINAKAFRGNEFFTYAEDRWQVSRKLTLNLGLRWEFYPPFTPRKPGRFSNYDPTTNNLVVAGIGGNPQDLGRQTHYKDFAPRFGIAYRLTEQTVVRGGFALSYFPYPDNDYAFDFPVLQNNAFPSLNGSSFTQSADAANNPISMASGFPAPLVANIPANGLIPVVGKVGTTSLLTQNYTVVNLKFREPYTESWNLAVQRALPGKFVAEVAYVGNHGVDLPTVYNLNAATLPNATATNKNRPLFALYGLTGNVALKFLGTSSNYNALQAKLDRKFSNGFLMTTAYTYSKALGYVNEGSNTINSTVGGLQNYIGSIRSNYAPLSFDRRHTIVQSLIYELPFGKGKSLLTSGVGSKLLGGWEVSTVLTVMTGLPLNITGGSPLNAPGDTQVPDLVGSFKILHGVGSPGPNGTPWFDVTPSNFITVNGQPVPQCRGAFCQTQGQGVLGNVARRVFSGPGFFNLDASVFRRFPIRERMSMELRAEAFSVTNTPQFDKPNQGFSTSTANNFGYVTNTIGGNRSVQLGAKLTF